MKARHTRNQPPQSTTVLTPTPTAPNTSRITAHVLAYFAIRCESHGMESAGSHLRHFGDAR